MDGSYEVDLNISGNGKFVAYQEMAGRTLKVCVTVPPEVPVGATMQIDGNGKFLKRIDDKISDKAGQQAASTSSQ
jgi:hypothetical protein